MSRSKKSLADLDDFRALAWSKFDALDDDEKVKMLKEYGLPADVGTTHYYFSQLIEIAIEQDKGLLGAALPRAEGELRKLNDR